MERYEKLREKILKINKHTTKDVKMKQKQHYKAKRHIFDKALRKAERDYKRGILDGIEKVNAENPKVFCNFIKTLGLRKTIKYQ